MACFAKEVNPSLGESPLKVSGGFAKLHPTPQFD